MAKSFERPLEAGSCVGTQYSSMMGICNTFICRELECTPFGQLTLGVITIIVFVFTSIQSLRSKVSGSLAIMMMLSRLSAFVIRYKPPSAYSSNDVPDEKNRDDASETRLEIYRVAMIVLPSETT